METIGYACHTAHLCARIGSGLLVRPAPEDDLRTGGLAVSLHEADWNNAMADLQRRGWRPADDVDGGLVVDGHTVDGREVVALYAREPISGEVTLEEARECVRELHRRAGSRMEEPGTAV